MKLQSLIIGRISHGKDRARVFDNARQPHPDDCGLGAGGEDAGFDGVFMTEANNDSLACSLGLGFNTQKVKLGTAITNIYLRHPNLLANEVAALHEFTGGRFISGSARVIGRATARSGSIWASPADPMKKMRATVATLRKMLEGGKTNPRVTTGKEPLYLAGVSRPMVRLAGEIADGVIFNFFPQARIKEALGEIAEGAQKAGRDPKEIEPACSRPPSSRKTWSWRASPRVRCYPDMVTIQRNAAQGSAQMQREKRHDAEQCIAASLAMGDPIRRGPRVHEVGGFASHAEPYGRAPLAGCAPFTRLPLATVRSATRIVNRIEALLAATECSKCNASPGRTRPRNLAEATCHRVRSMPRSRSMS